MKTQEDYQKLEAKYQKLKKSYKYMCKCLENECEDTMQLEAEILDGTHVKFLDVEILKLKEQVKDLEGQCNNLTTIEN